MNFENISSITADNGNLLIFHFRDGTTAEKTWKDHSRSESWTNEMRKRAGEQTKARCLKNG